MELLTIGYEFVFNVTVKKQNGKTFKSHVVNGIGCTYENAVWHIYFILKKKHNELIKINRARACRIVFSIQDGNPVTLKLADHLPDIPDDLNNCLKHLPKKTES